MGGQRGQDTQSCFLVNHPIETVGAELRAMMPWISEGKGSVRDASGGQG